MRVVLNKRLSKFDANKYSLLFGKLYNVVAVYGFMDELYFIIKSDFDFELVPSSFFTLVNHDIPPGWGLCFDYTYERYRYVLSFSSFSNEVGMMTMFIDRNNDVIDILKKEYDMMFKDLNGNDIVTVRNDKGVEDESKLYQIEKHLGGYTDLYNIIDMDTGKKFEVQRIFLKPYYVFT